MTASPFTYYTRISESLGPNWGPRATVGPARRVAAAAAGESALVGLLLGHTKVRPTDFKFRSTSRAGPGRSVPGRAGPGQAP
jgi:hypothetical protein